MWYVFYSILAFLLLVWIIGPLGIIGFVIAMVVINSADKLGERHKDKIDAFLKRHRMPPFHRDGLDKQ